MISVLTHELGCFGGDPLYDFFLTFSLPKCPTLISCNCDFIDLLLAVNKTPAKYFMLLLLLLMILMMMMMLKKIVVDGPQGKSVNVSGIQ